MPYRCRKCHKLQPDDVEYFEPVVEESRDTGDIRDFIADLDEPDRSVCSSVILDGEKIGAVAAAYSMSRNRVAKILRTSLRPLALELGIVRK